MGNCQGDNSHVIQANQEGQYPQQTLNQAAALQQQQQEQSGAYQRQSAQPYHSQNPQQDHNTFIQPQSAYQSGTQQRKKIDFENLGSNFMFVDDARKIFDDSPWQRDENDSSNRPSTLAFGANNNRQPAPNGLAIANSDVSMNQNQMLNLSMNRLTDKGYSQSILTSNRKKQNIFYESSTYNQNPYVKTVNNQLRPVSQYNHSMVTSEMINASQQWNR